MSLLQSLHVIKPGRRSYTPALDANFAADRSLVPRVGYPWTLTRASKAWDFNATPALQEYAIDAARFPYSLANGASLGLRLEEQRANLVGNANGRLSGLAAGGTYLATVATVAESTPFGTELIRLTFPVEASNAVNSYVDSPFFTATADTSYRFSVWVRGKGTHIEFYLANVSGSSTAATGRTVGDWVEYSSTFFRSSTTSTSARIRFYVSGGDGTSQSVDVAIGQVEVGTYATSPILGIAGITRSADVPTISGADFAALYKAGEGTVVWEGLIQNSGHVAPWNLYYAASTNYLGPTRYDTEWRFKAGDGGTAVLRDATTGLTPNTFCRAAMSWGAAGVTGAVNGFLAASTMGTLSTPYGLALFRRHNTSGGTVYGPNTGYTSRLRYYRERLPDAVLQELTTL